MSIIYRFYGGVEGRPMSYELHTLHLSTDTLCCFTLFRINLFVIPLPPLPTPMTMSPARQAIGTSSIVPLGWTTIPVIPLITVITVITVVMVVTVVMVATVI